MNIRRIISRTIKEPAGDRQNIIEAAYQEDPIATMRVLQMHVYAPITHLDRWFAIEAIGGLAGKYAPDSDELFRNVIRRFIWQMCEESAMFLGHRQKLSEVSWPMTASGSMKNLLDRSIIMPGSMKFVIQVFFGPMFR